MNTRQEAEKLIMGVDPGTNFMGYAIIRTRGKSAQTPCFSAPPRMTACPILTVSAKLILPCST